MARPIDAQKRAHVVELIRGGMGRNEVARESGVSVASVTKIAGEEGLSFDRTASMAATAARKADNAKTRAELTGLLYQRAREFLDQIGQPHTVFAFGGKDNVYNERTLDRPPTGDIRNLMTSTGIAVQRAAELERFDIDADAKPAFDMWLDVMMGGAGGRQSADREGVGGDPA